MHHSLLLRLGFNPKSSNKISFGAKFGCTFEAGKILLQKASELNLNIRGVAFHIGTGCQEYEIFAKAIKDSADMFTFGKSLGHEMGSILILRIFSFQLLIPFFSFLI